MMDKQFLFFVFWLFNFLSIYLLGLAFPNMIVLGNFRLTPMEASIYSGFWLTFFVWTMKEYMSVRKVEFEPPSLMHYYLFVVNCLGIWIVSRYSQYTGLGITSFWWAFVLGGAAEILQLVTWTIFGKRLKD